MVKTEHGDQWSAVPRKTILGIDVCDLSFAQASDLLYADLADGAHRRIAFLNANTANIACADAGFRTVLDGFTVLTDGIGVDLAAKLIYGHMFKANLNGTDFIPELIASAPHPLRIGLYGARPGVAEKACAALAVRDSRHEFRALGHGYLDAGARSDMLDDLRVWKADIVLVALGVPVQEKWIAENLTGDHATLVFGVGALFDFLAGEVPRAPEWMRRTRMEWVHRLAIEPMRLGRRYVVGNPLFLARALRQRLLGWSDHGGEALT